MAVVVGAVIFLILVVLPNNRRLSALEGKIKNMSFQLDEQKILHPIYQSISRKGTLTAEEADLRGPRQGPADMDLEETIEAIKRIAENKALTIQTITQDKSITQKDSRYLQISAAMKGDLSRLREFMLESTRIPTIEHIERLHLGAEKDGRTLVVHFWMTQN